MPRRMKSKLFILIGIFASLSVVRSEPSISAPPDFTADGCNLDTSPSRTGQASGNSSTACEAVQASVITSNDTLTALTSWGILINRLWVVTDGCNQSVNHTQLIKILVPKPQLNLPSNVSTTCADTSHPNTTGMPSVVSRPCLQYSVTFSYTDTNRAAGSCPDSMELIRRTFRIHESWGRNSYHVQNINVYAYVSPNITCQGNNMHVLISRDNYPYLTPERMHLSDPSCNASSFNSTHVMFIVPLHGCGTVRHVANDKLTFENKVVAAAGGPGDVRGLWHDVEFLVNCSYQRRVSVIGPSYTATRGKVQVKEAGYGNFTFSMLLYRSNLYNQPYQDVDFPLNVNLRQWLYLEVKVDSSESQLILFVDTCKAKSSLSANSIEYTFLRSGCSVDSSLVFNYQLSSSQRFSVQAFRFLDNFPTVYLQCDVLVCHVNDTSSRCNNGCVSEAKRRRRETEGMEKKESEKYTLSLGPITEKRNQGSDVSQQDSNIVPAITGAVSGTLVTAIICLTIVVILRMIRKKRAAGQDLAADEKGRVEVNTNLALEMTD